MLALIAYNSCMEATNSSKQETTMTNSLNLTTRPTSLEDNGEFGQYLMCLHCGEVLWEEGETILWPCHTVEDC